MKKNTFGILTFPVSESGSIPLSNLIEIFVPFSKKLYVITGNVGYKVNKNDNRIKIKEIKHNSKNSFIGRVFEYFLTQLKISLLIFKLREVDKWIFFIGGDTLVLPMFFSKLLRKKVFLLFAGSSVKTLKSSNDNFYNIAKILSKINIELADKLIVYSESIVSDLEIQNQVDKILIAHRHYINFDKFKIKTDVAQRKNIVGYIGRLSNEKGVMNFVRAIPLILSINKNLKFLICGKGVLDVKIKDFIIKNDLNKNVSFVGGIDHDEVPNFLNKIKLLIIPSSTEGLPNIMIESMACGTPVLVTEVGSIPDFVKNDENGFILRNNNDNCIAEHILDLFDHADFEKISKNGVNCVEKNFNFENVVKQWEKII